MPENTKNTQKTLFARRRRRKKIGKIKYFGEIIKYSPLVNHRSATRGGINNKNCTDVFFIETLVYINQTPLMTVLEPDLRDHSHMKMDAERHPPKVLYETWCAGFDLHCSD